MERSLLPTSRAWLVGALATFGLAAGSLACSATVSAEPGTGAATQRVAVLDVHVHQDAPVADALRVDASARFVAVKEPGAPADALDLLGLAWPAIPAGTCTAAEAPPVARTAVRVDLRDLSPVSLELRGDDAPPVVLQLDPKAFPDVAGLVSGVVFVAPAATALGAAPRLVGVQVAGSALGDLELPELPARLQLVDATSTDGGAFAVDARGLDVVAPSAAPGDRLGIDLLRGGVLRARCGFDPAGRLHIDATALGGAGESTLVLRAERHVLRDAGALGTLDARLDRSMDVKLSVR